MQTPNAVVTERCVRKKNSKLLRRESFKKWEQRHWSLQKRFNV
jgi:hypothetical protein